MDESSSRSRPVDTNPERPRPPHGATDPVRLAQYRVLKRLGEGGMGIVLLAEDEELGRKAALKVMRPEYAVQAQARGRFLREARATAALKHDNVVTIYQVGEDDGVPFLAMEYLIGKSLDDWLRPDRRASLPEALTVAKQIAKGLIAAHAVGLVHRDIKPANIWLEVPTGRVKILDFGLARHVAGEFTQLTQPGVVLGTPTFMAPEQVRGEQADHRCDLFSFGCVLYRMVTGRLPFQGNTVLAVLHAVASETPTSADTLNPVVPARLAALIAALLEKRPEDRPESAEAALAELIAIEKELKSPALVTGNRSNPATTVDSPAPLKHRSDRRLTWVLGVAGVAVLTCLLATAIVLRSYWAKPEQPPTDGTGVVAPPKGAEPVEAPKPALDPSVVGDWDVTFQNGKCFKFTFSPDGTMSGENGYNGHWSQDGLNVSFRGIGQKLGEKHSFWKGEIDPTGRTMNFTADGGVACVCVRRADPTRSVVGEWDCTFRNTSTAVFTFRADHTLTGTNGYEGKWEQVDRKVIVYGMAKERDKGISKWEGELDQSGRTMALTSDGGTRAAIYVRRLP